MTTANSHNDEQDQQQIQDNIEKFGCHLVLIEASNYLPAFVYSIGFLQTFHHPEIICFGSDAGVMAGIVNHGGGYGYQADSGIAGAQQYPHHDAVHPCFGCKPGKSRQPA